MFRKKDTWIRFFSLLTLSAFLAGCGALSGASLPVAPDAPRDTITVTGVGSARGNPDMATVTVGVNVADESVSAAVSGSSETVERITQGLQDFGVDPADIQTVNFSIWAEDQWDQATGQRREERLYRVESTVQVNLRQVDRVGELLQTAIENGANNIYGLNFGIEDASDLADEAREAAVENARQRAEHLAASLGVSLGQVVEVNETTGAAMPHFQTAGFGLGGGGGEPPISEGRMTVTASVDVTYELVR